MKLSSERRITDTSRHARAAAALLIIGVLLNTVPIQAQGCVSDPPYDPSSGWTSVTSFKNNHNLDMRDYGVLLRDADDPQCAEAVRDRLLAKINNTPIANPPRGYRAWLGGVTVTLALATALQLGPQGELDQDLDDAIMGRITAVYTDSNITWDTSCDPDTGNTCMDDYVTAAGGYAWIAAYLKMNGRNPSYQTGRAQHYLDMAFDTDSSVCVQDAAPRISATACRASNDKFCKQLSCLEVNNVAVLKKLIKSAEATVIPVNHDQETPHYGLGLFTSISNAVYGLQLAGSDWTPDPMAVLLGQELFKHAKCKVDDFPADPQYALDDCCDWEAGPTSGVGGESCRDRVILGGVEFHYVPTMIPVNKLMYDKFELAQRPDLTNNGYQFDTFGDSLFSRNSKFFNWGRAAIYNELAYDWPYLQPPAGGPPPLGGVSPIVFLDRPSSGQTLSGVVPMWGWATDALGVQAGPGQGLLSGLAFSVNYSSVLPYDLVATERQGACDAYPLGDPNCPWVGWWSLFNAAAYGNGTHSLNITASDPEGGATTLSRTFSVYLGSFAGASIDLFPIDDAFVRQDNPTANFGGSQLLRIRSTGQGHGIYSFLKFNLSSVPGSPRRAYLVLDNGPYQPIDYLAVWNVNNNSWNESTITWANMPVSSAFLFSGTRIVAPGNEVWINVSPILPSSVVSLGLTISDLGGGRYFYSKEKPTTSLRPRLRVYYFPWSETDE